MYIQDIASATETYIHVKGVYPGNTPTTIFLSKKFTLADVTPPIPFSSVWSYKDGTINQRHLNRVNPLYTAVQEEMADKLKIDVKRFQNRQSKLKILTHITKHNCSLLPYLNDESLHILGEFLFNVITKTLKLNSNQLLKVRKILNKDKSFYMKLIDVKTANPIKLLRTKLIKDPQIGTGIVSIIATLAPLIATLLSRI